MKRADSDQVDELIRATRARFVTRCDLTFDFAAGLADVYDRAGLLPEPVPARPRNPGPPPRSAAVALACEQLDGFCALLDSVWLAGEQPELPGSHIQRAREVLARMAGRLRASSGLATGEDPLARRAALTSAADLLGLADVLVRAHSGRTLDDVLTSKAVSPVSYLAVLEQLTCLIGAAASGQAAEQSCPPPGASIRRRPARHAASGAVASASPDRQPGQPVGPG